MNTNQNSSHDVLPSPELQVALAALRALKPLETELNYARRAGLAIVIPPQLEAEYVKVYGAEGQHFLDILLGRKETIASVKIKIRMRVDDPTETIALSAKSQAHC